MRKAVVPTLFVLMAICLLNSSCANTLQSVAEWAQEGKTAAIIKTDSKCVWIAIEKETFLIRNEEDAAKVAERLKRFLTPTN